MTRRNPMTRRQREAVEAASRFLASTPVAMAHRGGAGLPDNEGNENSLLAMRAAVDLGFSYIETDVQASADGVAFCFHDEDLSRLVGRAGAFNELTAAQIGTLRLRGGERIPTLAEVLTEFPDVRFNIDIKSCDAVEPALSALDAADAYSRIMLGSFTHSRLMRVRRLRPHAATSASTQEALALWCGFGWMCPFTARAGALAMQVPIRYRGRRVITPRFIRGAHKRNLQVHAWTIDGAETIHSLLDMGVDGIITDRPDVLKTVLVERGQWHPQDQQV